MVTKAIRRRGKKPVPLAHIASTNDHGEFFRVTVKRDTPSDPHHPMLDSCGLGRTLTSSSCRAFSTSRVFTTPPPQAVLHSLRHPALPPPSRHQWIRSLRWPCTEFDCDGFTSHFCVVVFIALRPCSSGAHLRLLHHQVTGGASRQLQNLLFHFCSGFTQLED